MGINFWTTAVLSAKLFVVIGALVGATAALYWKDAEPRSKMFAGIFASAFAGTVLAVLLSAALAWKWAGENMGALAGGLAMVAQLVMPNVIERCKKIISEFSFSWGNKGGKP